MNSPTSRGHLWLVLGLVAGVAAGALWIYGSAQRALKTPPAAYVVPIEEGVEISLGWRARELNAPTRVFSNSTVRLPEGKQVLVVYPDARTEIIKGPQRIQFVGTTPNLDDFLGQPLRALLAVVPDVPPGPAGDPIRITSPVGVTHYVTPEISWEAAPDLLYDVAVVDPADENAPPRIARGVKPPLSVAALETPQRKDLPTDRIFGVLVRKANDPSIGGATRFLVAADAVPGELPKSAPDLIGEAVAALAKKPLRTGDAWTAVSRLPPEWSNSELVLRLKLRLASELGLSEEVAKAREQLKKVRS